MVRRATRADADAVADVFIPSFRGLEFLPALHTDDETRAWIGNVVLATHEVWVAEDEDRVVGFAALEGDVLGHIYVHPDAQSQGIGTRLLDLIKRERPDGFRLWVFQRNIGARRFYERHGCTLVELTDGAGNEEREPDALYAWLPAQP